MVNQFLVGYKAQHGTIKEHSDKFVMIRCVSGVNAHASPRLIRLSCGDDVLPFILEVESGGIYCMDR